MGRFLGVDAGAETVKVVELVDRPGGLVWHRRARLEHHKAPGPAVREVIREWGWDGVDGAVASAAVAGSAGPGGWHATSGRTMDNSSVARRAVMEFSGKTTGAGYTCAGRGGPSIACAASHAAHRA